MEGTVQTHLWISGRHTRGHGCPFRGKLARRDFKEVRQETQVAVANLNQGVMVRVVKMLRLTD